MCRQPKRRAWRSRPRRQRHPDAGGRARAVPLAEGPRSARTGSGPWGPPHCPPARARGRWCSSPQTPRYCVAGEFQSPGTTQQCGSMGARPIPLTPGNTNLLNGCSHPKPPIPSLGPPIRSTHSGAGQEAELPDQTQRRPKLIQFAAGCMSSSGTGDRALIRDSRPARCGVGWRRPAGRDDASPSADTVGLLARGLHDPQRGKRHCRTCGAPRPAGSRPAPPLSSGRRSRSTRPVDRKESGLTECSTGHKGGITCAAAARWPAKLRRPSPRPYPLRPPWPRARSGPGASRAVASPLPANPW